MSSSQVTDTMSKSYSDFNEIHMDINIKTLTGTQFKLRVCMYDTVANVKQKIHQHQGIAPTVQNLLLNHTELPDTSTLCDCGIGHGDTLQLVVSMRGGPINMRRVPCEDVVMKEVLDLMDERDDLLEKIFDGKDRTRPVTLLVYKDGDRLSLIEVIQHDDDEHAASRDREKQVAARDLVQNAEDTATMRLKMKLLQEQMNDKKEAKRKKRRARKAAAAAGSATQAEANVGDAPALAAPIPVPGAEPPPPGVTRLLGRRGTLGSSKADLSDADVGCPPVVEVEASRAGGGKKGRCAECGRKLTLTGRFECACKESFCSKCRYPDQHGCTFDYKLHGQRQLSKTNGKVDGTKLPKIN